MGNESHTTSRHAGLFLVFLFVGLFVLGGCHDWPDERATAIEAQNILRDLSRIETIPDPNVEGPAVYKSPPKKLRQIVGGVEEWKLVYFCQYHTAAEMKQIINEQFASRVFDEKGKSVSIDDYTVTANPATNQLIVRCPFELDIDAVMEIIRETDIPAIQIRIDCMISELYADLTVDRETSMLIENLFGESITLGGHEDNDYLAFPGAALRDPAREKFGLKVGINRGLPGHRFRALVDILVSRGYLKILMNPTLEVVNGQTAKIQSRQSVPLQQIFLRYSGTSDALVETRTEYADIVDSLAVTPHVFADGYIGLETQAQIAAYLTPEGIKQTPIVTERTITTKDNRIRLGESLVIGGIRKSEKRDVVRGVPILKDIPVLSLLFSGRDFEERATEVIFILTPSISTGGRPNKDIVEVMRERHASPMTQSLQETVMDPLGTKAREQEHERRLEAARKARQAYETEMTANRLEALEAGAQIEDLQLELEQAKIRYEQASTTAQRAVSEAEEAKAQVQKAVNEAKQAREEATQTRSDFEKARSAAQEEPKETDESRKEPPPQDKADAPQEQPQQSTEPPTPAQ
ncbi:MAG: hypothetical protein A2Y77_10755 [Planctomycetes bacterium RBG_13_62_9]|nr:MAG: hypothetical protein A2Y77_10755 [Planctomycetes bacterium RBG_13_62_9]